MSSLKSTLLLIVLIFWSSSKSFSQDPAIATHIKHYTQKAENQLDKEKALSTFYSINTNGISIYASTQHKLKALPEFHIGWDKLDDFNTYLKSCSTQESFQTYLKGIYDMLIPCKSYSKASVKSNEKVGPLTGLKIAIDPGHIAGDMEMGDIEKKCLTFKCDSLKGLKDSIAISEGMLTFATAKLLKAKLEAAGAEVFMTRTFNGSSAFGVTFDEWLKTSYAATVDSLFKAGKISLSQKQFFMGSKASKRDKFRVVFKDAELSQRAKIINKYKPDLTIIIHFNVDETNTNWAKPANKNFNMTFVGGAFMKNDLSSPEKRFQFLRLLITDDLEKSITLSSAVIKSFEKNLNVKTASVKDATYLMEGCLPTSEPGVYSRNLQLTRYIHGPLVYGETLYQDNLNECILLNKECDKTKNERIQQVAEAYFQGILNYVQKQ